MNIGELATTTRRVALMSPHLLSHAVTFTYWHAARHLRGAEDGHSMVRPLSRTEAGRIAMEMVMVTRHSAEDPATYQPAMETIFEDLEDPQHMVDVSLALASMMSVVAEDADIAKIGAFIARTEAEEMA